LNHSVDFSLPGSILVDRFCPVAGQGCVDVDCVVTQGDLSPHKLDVVEGHNLGVGVVPAVPVSLGGPGVDTVGAAAAGEHHRVAGVEVAIAAHVVAQLQDTSVVFVVFECPAVGTNSPLVVVFKTELFRTGCI